MNENLRNLIPRKDNLTYSKLKPNYTPGGNKKAIIITIILIVVVIICIFGFLYIYNNYVKNTTNGICKTKESCFLEAAKACTPAKLTVTVEKLPLYSMWLKTITKYSIKGYNENNFCEYTIEILNAEVSYKLEDMLSYLDNIKNQNKIFEEYTNKLAIDQNIDITEINLSKEIKTEIIKKIKDKITENYNLVSETDIENLQLNKENVETKIIMNTEHCFFKDTIKMQTILKNNLKGIENQTTTETTMYNTKIIYDEGYCSNEN